ncbi:6-carboxytetrahydropterin synthase QueD [Acetivibrio clariflavus]|uniref:6-carboxy-5,6,7,8-tetrahydropterin synthase n=1 Tax=Acetivibrio clariflavus (strain DSM 19732 / NBRC 101661 / EBR45) TaxID=720554 RepID=G8LWS1_ACECE|nr:6-carboxytetrahydropterin synthase QueD [Acetivibrio clariflavus]AEV69782.1 queuosine biosynthesis protein QueD [Acetivibrio clariflavus DSM 19732]
MKISKVSITKVFTFDSAHSLIDYPGKCKNIHGHTYKLEVTLKGMPDKNGLVIDFHDLNDLVENEILAQIDHKYLNDILDFNPTCEMLGLWIWDQIAKKIKDMECSLEKLVLWETPTSYITIDAKDMKE